MDARVLMTTVATKVYIAQRYILLFKTTRVIYTGLV